MKVLVLHLSDLHFSNIEDYSKENVDSILKALPKKEINAILLIVSGDIAFSGCKKQYEVATNFFDALRNGLTKKYNINNIEIAIVPGNHDLDYHLDNLNHSELENLLKSDEKEEVINRELKKLKAFYFMSKQMECFNDDEIISIKLLKYENQTIQINLINTAVCSLISEEDKGLHYIPQYKLERMLQYQDQNIDFVFSVMHHSHHWFEYCTKIQLENILYERNDMIFFGHEHYIEDVNIKKNNANTLICRGGQLSNKGVWEQSEFYAGILNLTERRYAYSKFFWDVNERIYIASPLEEKIIYKNRINQFGMKVNEHFLQGLLDDKYFISKSYSDYYVFPLLEQEVMSTDNVSLTVSDMNRFLSKLQHCKKIIITGGNDYGKTALIKQVFKELMYNKFVIYLPSNSITNKNFEKIIKQKFVEIYSEDVGKYERFRQAESKNKVIIIDDMDSIKEEFQKDFFDYVENEFEFVIQTCSVHFDFDLKYRIKQKAITERYVIYSIQPLYSDKRKLLVSNIVRLILKEENIGLESQTRLINILCSLLNNQRSLFSFTPDFIIQFTKYYCINIGETIQNDGEIFSKVFEANLVSQIKPYAKKLSVDKIFIILGSVGKLISASF